jgi:hypothetical protein
MVKINFGAEKIQLPAGTKIPIGNTSSLKQMGFLF